MSQELPAIAASEEDIPQAREWRLPFGMSYSSAALRRDLLAGLTVAAISLPQAMAYALLAGVDPRYGLYSAIIVTAVASVFGSSSHLINGPTSAISLVIFGALAIFDPDQRVEAAEAMFLIGAMVGAIQIAIAVARLGDLTRYISEPVVLGFMSAAALLLAVGQISNALGMPDHGTGAQHVLYRLWLTLTSSDPINLKAVTLTLGTLILALWARRLVRRYRWPHVDLLAVLVLVATLAHLVGWTVPGAAGVKAAVATAGAVPAAPPSAHIPVVQLKWALRLAPDAVAIAFLGLLEALAIAKSIAHRTQQTLDFNQQCLAEGIANLTGAFFRCLPGSGSLSRSAINFQSGGATRFSGIITATAVLLAVLVLAPLARFVPKPALAALLLLTASRLIDLQRVRYVLRASRQDAVVLAITVVSALAFGLDWAILVGVGLSILLFVPRAARLKSVELVVDSDGIVRERLGDDALGEGFALYDLEGDLFFGAASELDRCLRKISQQAATGGRDIVILRLKRVRNPDVVCLEHLEHFLRDCGRRGTMVLLAGVRWDLLNAFRRLRLTDWFPSERIFRQRDDEDSATLAAIRAARDWLAHHSARAAPATQQLYYRI